MTQGRDSRSAPRRRGGDAPRTDAAAAETLEREKALRRGRERRRPGPPRHPGGEAAPEVLPRAFALLAEGVRDYAVFLLDPHGVITFWGEGARLIQWWTRDEAEGAHLRLLYPEGGAEDGTAEEHLEEAARSGEYTGEGQRVRSDGSTFWAGLTLTALRGAGGELIGFAKVTRDLTARRAADAVMRAAQEAAEAARRDAEDANRAKSHFLATMSHEIRTPINAVMGYVDLLEMEVSGALNPQQHHHLGRIRASSRHLLGVVDDVLDFARLEAGRVSLARQVSRLAPAIEGALQLVQTQAQASGVMLSDSVSGFAAEVPFIGDPDRVRQILVVLLSNAVKFTPSGGRITVSAGTAQRPPGDAGVAGPGPWLYVRVEDTGPGIPADRVGAIFEPFEQGDPALTRVHGGTGLGLSIARRLAGLMGGNLSVRSYPGSGSTFFLWLPAAAEEALDTALSRSEGMDAPGPRLLQEARGAILAEMERVLHAYVARLRSDPGTPSAAGLDEAELEDHLVTFLSDLAETFSSLNLAAGADAVALRDSTLIQRTIAERHGRQRRFLKWSRAELAREFEILREEVAAAIRRRMPDARTEELDGTLDAAAAFITAAERTSLAAYGEAD